MANTKISSSSNVERDITTKEEDPNCYYEYHHGTGRHVLTRPDPDVNRPKWSWTCVACNCCDLLIFLGCVAFLFFSIRYAFYLLENGGDD